MKLDYFALMGDWLPSSNDAYIVNLRLIDEN